MSSGDPLSMDPFGKDEDEEDEENDDMFEMEIPQFTDEVNLPMMAHGVKVGRHVRRPVNLYNPGNIPGLGNRFFSAWGSKSVILHG